MSATAAGPPAGGGVVRTCTSVPLPSGDAESSQTGQKAAREQLPPVAAVTPGQQGRRICQIGDASASHGAGPGFLGIETGACTSGGGRHVCPRVLRWEVAGWRERAVLFCLPYLTCHQNIQTHNALGQKVLVSCLLLPAGALLRMHPMFIPIATCLVAH